MNKNHSPRVDFQWIKHFPEHQNYAGQALVHHHIDHGHLVTALPDALHRTRPGYGMFHNSTGESKK